MKCQRVLEPAHTAVFRPTTGDIHRVVAMVSRHSKVPQPLIFSRSRCRIGTARARQLAMYLSHVILGETLTAIGIAFGRDRTTVSYACALIEDMRDDPDFDAEVSAIELALQGAGD
ncbi:helix-turn-helix domain-containing protein [Devosia sediminis]|nr:helix-turn-helix domain-containing protein [Devosia sediminis]